MHLKSTLNSKLTSKCHRVEYLLVIGVYCIMLIGKYDFIGMEWNTHFQTILSTLIIIIFFYPKNSRVM